MSWSIAPLDLRPPLLIRGRLDVSGVPFAEALDWRPRFLEDLGAPGMGFPPREVQYALRTLLAPLFVGLVGRK